jgi:hypothetical protein
MYVAMMEPAPRADGRARSSVRRDLRELSVTDLLEVSPAGQAALKVARTALRLEASTRGVDAEHRRQVGVFELQLRAQGAIAGERARPARRDIVETEDVKFPLGALGEKAHLDSYLTRHGRETGEVVTRGRARRASAGDMPMPLMRASPVRQIKSLLSACAAHYPPGAGPPITLPVSTKVTVLHAGPGVSVVRVCVPATEPLSGSSPVEGAPATRTTGARNIIAVTNFNIQDWLLHAGVHPFCCAPQMDHFAPCIRTNAN